MRQEQKWFLLVWIPVLIIVNIGIFNGIGSTVIVTKTTNIGVERIGVRYQTLSDVLVPMFVSVVLSIVMYIIVSLEKIDKVKVKENERIIKS